MTYLANTDADDPLTSLQATSCTYRITLGPRARQKVLSLHTVARRDVEITHGLCIDAHSFSLQAEAVARINARNANGCASKPRAL